MLSKLIKNIKAKRTKVKVPKVEVIVPKKTHTTFKVDKVHWEDTHWFI